MTKNSRSTKLLAAVLVVVLVFTFSGCSNNETTQSQPGDQSYIGADAAKQAALKHSGLKAEQIDRISAELNRDATPACYSVEFYCGADVYLYSIDAISGEVLRNEKKPVDSEPGSQPGATRPVIPDASYMDPNGALEFALDHAGAMFDQITLVSLKLDESDVDRVHYDCVFTFEAYKYRYEVHAVTGEVLDFEVEELNDGDDPFATVPPPTQPPAAQIIEQDAALTAALEHQGASKQDVEVVQIDLHDGEDGEAYGTSYYEITFDWDGFRYEYHIDGITGDVLTYEVTEAPGGIVDDDPENDEDDGIYDDDEFIGEDDDPFLDDEGGFNDEPDDPFGDEGFDE